jgi:hypothetical protein
MEPRELVLVAAGALVVVLALALVLARRRRTPRESEERLPDEKVLREQALDRLHHLQDEWDHERESGPTGGQPGRHSQEFVDRGLPEGQVRAADEGEDGPPR